CFAHVIALVVKAILSQFSRKRAAKGEKKPDIKKAAQKISDNLSDHDLDADEEAKAQQEKDVDHEAADEKILDALEEEYPDLVLSHDEIQAGQLALEKIQKLSTKVWNIVPVRTELGRLAVAAGLDCEVLVR
ncbi:hypothetical protein LXA43DRAFT_841611, partial [Ganoderma leucocontextum]